MIEILILMAGKMLLMGEKPKQFLLCLAAYNKLKREFFPLDNRNSNSYY